MKSFQERHFAFESQMPEWCFDSNLERLVFSEFRENYLLPSLQHNIGIYFADFAFPRERIIVEMDGMHHLERQVQDAEREAFLVRQGWRVIRIRDTGAPMLHWQLVDSKSSETCTYHALRDVVEEISRIVRLARKGRFFEAGEK